MQWLISLLLASTWLFDSYTAWPLDAHEFIAESHVSNYNKTLMRRVRVGSGAGSSGSPPKATDVFSLGDATTVGGCSSALIDSWLEEAFLLHKAIETAYDSVQSDTRLAVFWIQYFGIKFNNDGTIDTNDDLSSILWKDVGNYISAVSQFLSGGGIPRAAVPGNPWIFCSEDSGEYTPYNQPVKNSEGSFAIIDKAYNEAGELVPTELLTLDDVFIQEARNPDLNPFFIKATNSYTFDSNGYETLCGKPTLFATTGRPQNTPDSFVYEQYEVTLGLYNRHILFCPPTFHILADDPGYANAPHNYPSLAQAVSADNYPSGNPGDGTPVTQLDRLLPISATLYHELYHLTDSEELTTDDPFNSIAVHLTNIGIKADLVDILKAGQLQIGVTPKNPESYAFLAMAAYMYLNAPEGKEPVIFVGGLPLEAKYINLD
ncbi:hypothetical protein ONZ43_g2377 [Nemania bipapillata]|uniref:Uncharacterized protein n=1 Tax=Nemania bipapillata TaxID=110536 RepID=A0ACC2J0U7_9PEZI|nr:hypothetical protein ONZ43_g2377 [Nemania bipapillata]